MIRKYLLALLATLALALPAQAQTQLPCGSIPQTFGAFLFYGGSTLGTCWSNSPAATVGGTPTPGHVAVFGSVGNQLVDGGVGGGGGGGIATLQTNNGLSGGPIDSNTQNPTLGLAPIASGALLANPAGGNGIPQSTALSALLDFDFGSAQGSVLKRSVSGWAVLTPGTSGQVLTTQGAGADPTWTTVAGTGTVTSAGLTVPAQLFSCSGSPVTTVGTIACNFATAQTANRVIASDGTGAVGLIALTGSHLPLPGVSSKGGVFSKAAVTHQFLNSISSVDGSIGQAQPACGDLSDFGSGCQAATGTSGHTIPFNDGNNVTAGNNQHNGTENFQGAILQKVRVITAAGAVTVSATTDHIICVAKTVGAATTVNLPAGPTAGLSFVIKDCKGDAATNNITITPAAGTIEGAATLIENINRQSVTIVYSGVEWIAL